MSHSEWVLDSDASHYMSPDSSSFTSVFPLLSILVMTVDDTLMPLTGVGSIVTPHSYFFSSYFLSSTLKNIGWSTLLLIFQL
jgi:hypothetical protein